MFPILLIILPCVAPIEMNGSERKASCVIKKVNDIKIVFMKNSDLDISMPNKRSPKASLFATHLFYILLNA